MMCTVFLVPLYLEEGVRSLGAVIIGNCEPPDAGVEHRSPARAVCALQCGAIPPDIF